MGTSNETNLSLKSYPSSKLLSVESSLQQTFTNFKELVAEIEELHSENKKYRNMYLFQKEQCERKICDCCEDLNKQILTLKGILESVVTALNTLSETRDFNILDAIFKFINRDTDITTPPKYNKGYKELISPKKELPINDEVPCDESLSQIDATPSRKSPIIQSKKFKSSPFSLTLKEKKKCPESWPTPEKKIIKLTFPTPTRNTTSGRLKQTRLNLVKKKTSSVIDLTCSPETARIYSECNIKREILENEDTILPSPTSGSTLPLPNIYKSVNSPVKFKKPGVDINCKLKIEKRDAENMSSDDEAVIKEVEDSINLLKPFPNRFKSPLKMNKLEDVTHCPDESISLLQHVKKIEDKSKTINSPKKRPLVENTILVNTEKLPESQSSASVLQDVKPNVRNELSIKSRVVIEPVYKEPVLRKKAEKRALPGWNCDECKNFYDELYKDDLEMLAKKMDECSKHRGRNNPIRPKTPDGFWNPRWDVPEDTEEFNLRNNAL